MRETETEVEKEIILEKDELSGFVRGLEFSKEILISYANSMTETSRRVNINAKNMLEVKYNSGYHSAIQDILHSVGTAIGDEIQKWQTSESAP